MLDRLVLMMVMMTVTCSTML